jgi:hypothetical protein
MPYIDIASPRPFLCIFLLVSFAATTAAAQDNPQQVPQQATSVSPAASASRSTSVSSKSSGQTQTVWNPCGKSFNSASKYPMDNYPVVVYDARTQTAMLAFRADVQDLLDKNASASFKSPIDLSGLKNRPAFLCYGRPAEFYVFNRRVKTDYTVTVTAVSKSSAGRLEISGGTPSAAASTATPSSAAVAPAAKGFAPPAPATNLLTTDQAIKYFLSDETFDRPMDKLQDDAALVLAQAEQFRSNDDQYLATLDQMIGGPHAAGEGDETLLGIVDQFKQLKKKVDAGMATERDFEDWTRSADILIGELPAINGALQAYPMVDTLTNLRASAAILNDNVRGVINEFRSVLFARSILLKFANEDPGYLRHRSATELKSQLRTQYPTTTIDDPTLNRIVETRFDQLSDKQFVSSLKARLIDLHAGRAAMDWADRLNSKLCERGKHTVPCSKPVDIDLHNDTVNDGDGGKVEITADIVWKGFAAVDFSEDFERASNKLHELQDAVAVMNEVEEKTLYAINDAYDESYASYQPLILDLSAYPNYAFRYSISRTEGFYPYQVIHETPQPQSNCALTISANTNIGGGAVACVTASTITPPTVFATFSGIPPTSYVPTPPPSIAAAAAAPATPATPLPTSANVPQGTAMVNSFGQITILEYDRGKFELHRFSGAALITGVAYDSVGSPSYSWFTCPTSPTLPAGNDSSAPPGCISPTTAAGATTTAPTYYELVKSSQTTVTVVEGINFNIVKQDTYIDQNSYPHSIFFTPSIFFGASAYPLNHYYFGLSESPIRELSITGGLSYGSQTKLPANYPYAQGSVVDTAPALLTSSTFKPGYFVMIGFHTSLFGKIFNGSIFQSSSNSGQAASPSSTSTTP